MAWVDQLRLADGGLTARVIWRLGGGRDALGWAKPLPWGQLRRTWRVRRPLSATTLAIGLGGDVEAGRWLAPVTSGIVDATRIGISLQNGKVWSAWVFIGRPVPRSGRKLSALPVRRA